MAWTTLHFTPAFSFAWLCHGELSNYAGFCQHFSSCLIFMKFPCNLRRFNGPPCSASFQPSLLSPLVILMMIMIILMCPVLLPARNSIKPDMKAPFNKLYIFDMQLKSDQIREMGHFHMPRFERFHLTHFDVQVLLQHKIL